MRRGRPGLALAGFVALTLAVGVSGAAATAEAVREWYPTISKPSWNPPAWIFGPVWTTLYVLMALAAWRVWRRDGWGVALALFLVQLAFNAAWSPLFFGLRRMDLALADIVLLLLALAATTVAFFRSDRMAGWLLVPYLGWVAFAALLNLTLVHLNSG